MTKVFNKTAQKDTRRELRKNMPIAEILLWAKLRGKGLLGCKFRRQYSVGNYVVDFYCPSLKLAVEVDGESHYVSGAAEYDRLRQSAIEKYGIHFLRVTNRDIYDNLEGVLYRIMEIMSKAIPEGDLPQPLLGKEG